MKKLVDYKKEIHSCSKCGLCQSVCPIYKITGNDCTVSRGHFIMLHGVIKGDLKLSKQLNKYLDLCLKCGACSKFCPSGIDVVDIIATAKAEYFKHSFTDHLLSFLQRTSINTVKFISRLLPQVKSQKFSDKVIFFEGCGEAFRNKSAVVNLLNKCNIEVISPAFDCCGIPFFVRGDFNAYKKCITHNLDIIKTFKDLNIVTTCASCEKTLQKSGINVSNIFNYIQENNLKFKLKKSMRVTFHKPCNLDNFQTIEHILKNTENLEYIEMKDYDKCCGLNGISKISDTKIMLQYFQQKRNNICASGANIVLTTCPGCAITLQIISGGHYKVMDFTEFLAKYCVI